MTMEKKMNKVVAEVAGAASGQMVQQAKTARGWVRVAWIIGASILGAIGWLFGAGQEQPAVSEPPAAVERAGE